MTDDSLLDTPVSPADQALAARLTLAALDGDADRVHAGMLEAVADPNRAVAVVGLLTRHLAITMVGRHGAEKTRAMLTKVVLDAGGAAEGPIDGMTPERGSRSLYGRRRRQQWAA
jgi:hypothetical protein